MTLVIICLVATALMLAISATAVLGLLPLHPLATLLSVVITVILLALTALAVFAYDPGMLPIFGLWLSVLIGAGLFAVLIDGAIG